MLLALFILFSTVQAEEPTYYCFHTEKLWQKETVGDQEIVIMDVSCRISYPPMVHQKTGKIIPPETVQKVYKAMCPYNKNLDLECGFFDFSCDSKKVDRIKNEAIAKCAQSFEKLKSDLKCEEACTTKKNCKVSWDKACTFRKLKAVKAHSENPMYIDQGLINRKTRLDNAIEGRPQGEK